MTADPYTQDRDVIVAELGRVCEARDNALGDLDQCRAALATAEAALEAERVAHAATMADKRIWHNATERLTDELTTAEAALEAKDGEVERLRAINRELVCSHNDLLVVIARMEDSAAALAPSTPSAP